jgi:hypothetical protein
VGAKQKQIIKLTNTSTVPVFVKMVNSLWGGAFNYGMQCGHQMVRAVLGSSLISVNSAYFSVSQVAAVSSIVRKQGKPLSEI